MRSKVLSEVCVGLLGIMATPVVSASAVTEYTSAASWTAGVSNVSAYRYSGEAGAILTPFTSVDFGPGTFTTGQGFGLVFNDGQYGAGVQYVSDDPIAFGGGDEPASVTVSFKAAADVTALAFILGADSQTSSIDISINGSTLSALAVSPVVPTAFFGATDASDAITNVTFTAANFGELDVIGSYETGSAVVAAPEINLAPAINAITILIGGLAVLRGAKRTIGLSVALGSDLHQNWA